MTDDLPLPMDVEDNSPPPETDAERTERERDAAGRFAPRQPAGQPDETARERRERAERDEYKRKFEDRDREYAALQKRLDDMGSLLKGDDPEAPPADPLRPLFEKVEAIDKRLSTQDEERQQAQQFEQVRSFADQDEARFRAEQPDFPNAVQHYIQSRLGELQALGYDQATAEAALTQEAQQLLIQCAQQNRSPAETIYGLAKFRGYQAGSAAPYQPEQRQQPQPPQRPAGGRSFGTGGGAPGGGMTAAQIASMSEADYMSFRNTPEGQRTIRRAMGG